MNKATVNQTQKHPIFNDKYEIISSLGEGNTSKVYLCRLIENPKIQVALKLLREEFLQRDEDSIKSVEQEIQILQGLKHQNIVNILGYGADGFVKKPSGREIKNLVFIILEYIPGGLLFDLCQTVGGMGEDGGRFFLSQMVDVLSYMQAKNVVHRDLKLENILVDEQLNLKVADFGFATYKKINSLNSYRGTMTYMAPEIKEGKTYDGKKIDIFSTGVILFIIVLGIFPFKEAKKEEYFYSLIIENKLETYWKKVGGQQLSSEFKDLILSIFSYDPKKRPSIEEIKKHPWMQKAYSVKLSRNIIIEKLQEKRSQKTADSDRANTNSRSICMNKLIRETSEQTLQLYKFNDMTDHDIDVNPSVIWEELNAFNSDFFDSKLKLELNFEKKYITLQKQNSFSQKVDFLIKLKFFGLKRESDEESNEPQRLRLRFQKKQGNIHEWYDLFEKLKEASLENLLLAPRIHQAEQLTFIEESTASD